MDMLVNIFSINYPFAVENLLITAL